MDASTLPGVESLLRAALEEDLGRGDVTTRLTVPEGRRGAAVIRAKEDAVVAGLVLVPQVFRLAGDVAVSLIVADGARVKAGDELCRLQGSASAMLSGERVALNLVQQLSGVATLTDRFVRAIEGTNAKIVDTRKTVPGLRVLQKYAVRLGGGGNHRFGLDDGILIKDNHIAAAGGVGAAVRAARAGAPHGLAVEVECESAAQIDEALAAGAAIILLDNMDPPAIRAAVEQVKGRALLEASGGVRLETARRIAEAGVDLISVGALTHSAPAIDISMRWLS